MSAHKKGFLLAALLFFLVPLRVFAAGATLSTIGGINVAGSKFSHFWYTTSSPTLTGSATAGDTISVSVDSVATNVITDSAGVWKSTVNVTTGDHQISLSDAGTVFSSFTLTIGTPPDNLGSSSSSSLNSSPSSLPVTGAAEYTLILLGAAALLIVGSRFIPHPEV